MQNENVTTFFSRLGINASEISLMADNETIEFAATLGGFGKLQSIPANTLQLVTIKGSRVIGRISLAELSSITPARAERAKRSFDGNIASKTVYEITPNTGDVNILTLAEMGGDEGFAIINGEHFTLFTAAASDYYQVGELSDPARVIYAVEYLDPENKKQTLSAYGVTNLLRRIQALKVAITPTE